MRRVILVFGFLLLLSGTAFSGERIAEGSGILFDQPAIVRVYRYPSSQAANDSISASHTALARDRAFVVLPSNTLVMGMNFVDLVYEGRLAILGTSATVLREITILTWHTRFGPLVVAATYTGNGLFRGFIAEPR